MNKGLYSAAGWVLMIGGILAALIAIINSIHFDLLSRGYGQGDFYYELFVSGFVVALIIFVLSFFPGKLYSKLGKDNTKINKLTNTSLVLLMISMVLGLISLFMYLVSFTLGNDEGIGMLILSFILTWPAGIIYGVAVLLLIINWFKTR